MRVSKSGWSAGRCSMLAGRSSLVALVGFALRIVIPFQRPLSCVFASSTSHLLVPIVQTCLFASNGALSSSISRSNRHHSIRRHAYITSPISSTACSTIHALYWRIFTSSSGASKLRRWRSLKTAFQARFGFGLANRPRHAAFTFERNRP